MSYIELSNDVSVCIEEIVGNEDGYAHACISTLICKAIFCFGMLMCRLDFVFLNIQLSSQCDH